MLSRRQLLRKSISYLKVGVDILEVDVVEFGALLSKPLERDIDVLGLAVIAWIFVSSVCLLTCRAQSGYRESLSDDRGL